MGAQAGLYVHVPFCRGKCAYCSFYSVSDRAGVSAWAEALLREADLYRNRFERFDTLYVGGGTPSFLSPTVFRKVLSGLRERFSLDEKAEVTLEVNPEDVSLENAGFWLEEGVTRISVGVQSLDDACLKRLGRRHTGRQALMALEVLRLAGCANLSVDLIWGLPGQGLPAWLETLREVLAFDPEHCSCYELTVEKGTPLATLVRRGLLHVPDEETACAFFEHTSDLLHNRGYIHYEISNYARSEALLSRHNLKYWRHVPYLGLGPSAHSFDGRRRWANVRSVSRYVERLRHGEPAVDFVEELTGEKKRLERLFLGFRTREGVSMDVAVAGEKAAAALREAVAEGFFQIHKDSLIPTRKGWLVADRLPLLFC